MLMFSLVFVVIGVSYSLADVASSVSGLQELMKTEKALIKHLERYLNFQEVEVEFLERKVQQLKSEHKKYEEDKNKYLDNPINQFRLIRRLTSEWSKWEKYLSEEVGDVFLKKTSVLKQNYLFPEYPKDLNDAVSGIRRLQDTYKLNIKSFANGEIDGTQYDSKLSSEDCVDIGLVLVLTGNIHLSDVWFEVSIDKFIDHPENKIIGHTIERCYQFAILSKSLQDDLEGAVSIADTLLAINPSLTEVVESREDYIKQIGELKKKGVPLQKRSSPIKPSTFLKYEAGCRGEYPAKSTKLNCFLNLKNMTPFKVEQVHSNPEIVIVHDFISDTEIEILKSIAKPLLTRATIFNVDKRAGIAGNDRTSQYAWFEENDHSLIPILNRRIGGMTELSMRFAEKIQVMNYGLGGHYSTHYDYFDPPRNKESFKNLQYEFGNRIATVLVYMNDIEQGGSTVFPELQIAVQPEKGSAVFWYNLKTNGDGDTRTLHAACPVLYGSKWGNIAFD
ncbi:hypothetical protein ACFFRR_005737 [Megaselia abdita]